MTGPRRPWWGHNSAEMALSLGRTFHKCADGCGALIIVAPTPDNKSWIPLEQVGEVDDPMKPGNKLRLMEIHHDNCVNPRVPGVRDPARSHRITVNEDEPAVAEEQVQFTLRRQTA